MAVLENGNLEEFQIEHPSEERIVGSIFKGRIQNLEDGLQAAFVDIGMKKNAFVHYWDMIPEDAARLEAEEGVQRQRPAAQKRFAPGEMAKRFPAGSEIVVQVTKGADRHQGPARHGEPQHPRPLPGDDAGHATSRASRARSRTTRSASG